MATEDLISEQNDYHQAGLEKCKCLPPKQTNFHGRIYTEIVLFSRQFKWRRGKNQFQQFLVS